MQCADSTKHLMILGLLGQRSMSQVKSKHGFAHYLENCLSQSFQIPHADWSW